MFICWFGLILKRVKIMHDRCDRAHHAGLHLDHIYHASWAKAKDKNKVLTFETSQIPGRADESSGGAASLAGAGL